MPAHFLPVFRAALAALDDAPAAPGGALSCDLIERVIAACQKINSPDLARMMSLLRRFEAEAARQRARVFAADAAAARPAPPLLVRLEPGAMDEADEPAGAPLLIAAAQSTEPEAAAPPVLPEPIAEPTEEEAAAPLVELPPDRIAALTEAA